MAGEKFSADSRQAVRWLSVPTPIEGKQGNSIGSHLEVHGQHGGQVLNYPRQYNGCGRQRKPLLGVKPSSSDVAEFLPGHKIA